MNHIKLFESFNLISHLEERGIDIEKTRFITNEKDGDVYFFLYNLSGQMVGYQKYNPLYQKLGQNKLKDPEMAKYFNWVGPEGNGRKIAVWGLETVNIGDKYIFITEGIFDIVRVHKAGYPGVAVLCNNPSSSLKSWLKTLPQKKIVIYDNDEPGRKLMDVGDYCFSVSGKKDLNDLSQEMANKFIENCIKKIKND